MGFEKIKLLITDAGLLMQLSLSEEQLRFQAEVRAFVDSEIAPRAAEADRTSSFPWELLRKMGERGLLGIPIPKEYGGLGKDTISYLLAILLLSKDFWK